MRTFFDLKNFIGSQRGKTITVSNSTLQVYHDSYAMNITIDSQKPIIKFEERSNGDFLVGVAKSMSDDIHYALDVNFKLDDKITSLIDVFPDAYLIDKVVATLLQL